ncbi:outer membrane beta-barrel protein [Yoonia sp. SS1-5]|uniref:Outer membrane beta-barrel protein n=1 Tax=Yoonia rhodophyticola TaxID=3137370 RepID=A0AAN0NHG7_9RHOB
MSYNKFVAAAVCALVSSAATAQGITGGELGFGYSTFLDDDIDTSLYTFNGGVEIGFSPEFSLGLSGASYSAASGDEDNITDTNITVHGIFNLNDATALGVFVGRDFLAEEEIDPDDPTAEIAEATTYVGAEARTSFAGGSVEGYLGFLDSDIDGDDDVTQTIFGVEAAYEAAPSFDVLLGIDSYRVSDDDESITVTAVSIGGAYKIAGGPSIYGEFGNVSISGSDGDVDVSFGDESFVGLGVTYTFGPAGTDGAFGSRSRNDAIGF